MPRSRRAPAAGARSASSTTVADGALVALCLEGDQDAWARLVARYRRLVHSVALKLGLAPEDAEDVFQRTFLALLENLHALRDRDRVGPWLAVTARRKGIEILRRRGSSREVEPGDAFDPVEGSALPVEELVRMERQAAVREAVESLPGRCRDLLHALFYEDPPAAYDEIARRLGMRPGSIGPTRARCLEKLEALLAGTAAGATYFPAGSDRPTDSTGGPSR